MYTISIQLYSWVAVIKQEYFSKIHSHIQDIDICTKTNLLSSSGAIITKSERINYTMKGKPKLG